MAGNEEPRRRWLSPRLWPKLAPAIVLVLLLVGYIAVVLHKRDPTRWVRVHDITYGRWCQVTYGGMIRMRS